MTGACELAKGFSKNTISILLQIKSDSSNVNLAMQSWKLRSKVSNDRCAWIMYTCELAKRLSKIDLYINEEGMYDMGISGGDYDED